MGITRITLMLVVCVAGAVADGVDYGQQTRQWQMQKEQALRADDGWLTVVGLGWLHPGNNTFGSDKANDIVLPASAPGKAGWFDFDNGVVTLMAVPALDIRVNGKPITTGNVGGLVMKTAKLATDGSGHADKVTLGDITMFPISRGERVGMRVKDKNSKARREFTGMKFYSVNPVYRIVADFVPAEKGATIKVPNILGQVSDTPTPGHVEFTLNGQKLRLDPVTEGDELFFIFKDDTAGKGTYPPGRFLYTAMPKDGKVVLDFNQAVSPPCAWTNYATCPLPPNSNVLPVAIEAGEIFQRHP